MKKVPQRVNRPDTRREKQKETEAEGRNLINSVHNAPSLPLYKVSVGAHEVNAIADSGSCCSVLSPEVFARIQHLFPRSKVDSKERLFSISGENLPTKGVYRLPITVEGKVIYHELHVLTKPMRGYELLMGFDLLKANNCRLEAGKSQVFFPKLGIHLREKNDSEPAWRGNPTRVRERSQREKGVFAVSVVKAILPPHCSARVPVQLRRVKTGSQRTVSNPLEPEGSRSFVEVSNPGTQPLHVNKGTKLLKVTEEPLDEEESEMWYDRFEDKPGEKVSVSDFQLDHLEREVRNAVESLLEENLDIFAKHSLDFRGLSPELITHKIELKPGVKIPKSRVYGIPYHLVDIAKKEVDQMLEHGIIRECKTDPIITSPLLLVKKPGCDPNKPEYRPVTDYRVLNSLCEKYHSPVTGLWDIVHSIPADSAYFSCIDLVSAFFQIRIQEGCEHLTAFVFQGKVYEYLRMPQGLVSSAQKLQVLTQRLFAHLRPSTLCYFDDILTTAPDWRTGIENLRKIFSIFRETGLRAKPSKCRLMFKKLDFLGVTLTQGGYFPADKHIQAIKRLAIPTTRKQLRKALGVFAFLQSFIDRYASICRPLTNLLRSGVKFQWTQECNNAWDEIRRILCTQPVLAFPRLGQRFHLFSDASSVAVASILTQKIEGRFQPLAYYSHKCNQAQSNYCSVELELMSIVFGLNRFRKFILGAPLTIHTDSKALTWLMSQSNPPSAKLCRWKFLISEFFDSETEIEFIPGNQNGFADLLSRHVQAVSAQGPESTSQPQFDTTGNSFVREISPEVIKKCQGEDVELSSILQSLQGELSADSAKLSEKFSVIDGILYCVDVDKRKGLGQRRLARLVVPSSLKVRCLENCHEQVFGGHFGIKTTYEKLSRQYFWKGMFKDCADFVNSCKVCLMQRGFKPGTKAELKPWKFVPFPGHTFAMDCLTLGDSIDGFKYCLVLVDCFSRMTEVAALKSLTAEETAQAIVDHLICRHGLPKKIISDLGSNFKSEILTELWKTFRVQVYFSSPSHAATNGIAEKHVHLVKKTMASIVSARPHLWSKYTQVVAWLLNSICREGTHYTPFFIHTGRDPRMPGELLEEPIQFSYCEEKSFTQDLVTRLRETYQIIRENLDQATEVRIARRQKVAKDIKFEIGDLVFVNSAKTPENVSRALAPKAFGPMRVVKPIGTHHYEVEKIGQPGGSMILHKERLFICPSRSPFLCYKYIEGDEQTQPKQITGDNQLPRTSHDQKEIGEGEEVILVSSEKPIRGQNRNSHLQTHSYNLRSRVGEQQVRLPLFEVPNGPEEENSDSEMTEAYSYTLGESDIDE